MPPKKKPDKKKEPEEEPVGYNLTIMSQEQLKRLARLLESEIEDMRKHCSFYQKTEDELLELMRITEEDLRENNDGILSKDVELEKLKLEFSKHLHQKRQLPNYLEHTTTMHQEKLSVLTLSRLEDEENRHFIETKRLQAILQEKDRQLEALRVKNEMAQKEIQEKNEKQLQEMEDHHRKLLAKSTKSFDAMMEETEKEFQKAKEIMESEAVESKIMGEREFNDACQDFKEKLHDYYKEVTREDLDIVKKLKGQIKNVDEKIKIKKIELKTAQQKNEFLTKNAEIKMSKRNPINTVAKFNAHPLKVVKALNVHNKIEKLAKANQDLEEQIKYVTDKVCNLRQQFTLGLKKVRESSEQKTVILERKLNSILDEKQSHAVTKTTITSGKSGYEASGDESADSSATL